MEGKVALVTGANTGIGLETARGLYRMGAHVVLACRSKSSAEKAMESIKASADTPSSGHGTVEYMHLDLSSLDNVRDFAQQWRRRRHSALTVLVNNAGMNSFSVQKGLEYTADGFDRIWQVNYLSHFLLTSLLVDSLKAGGPSRVVNLSSVMHRAHMKATDFTKYSPRADGSLSGEGVSSSYSDSKLAMAMVSFELQRRLASHDITVHAVNPGAVNSDIWRDFPGKKLVETLIFNLFFLRTSQGAATSIAAATDPELGDKRTRYLSPYWHPASRMFSKQGPSPRWRNLLRMACPIFDVCGPFSGARETMPAAVVHDPAQCKALYELSEAWTRLK